MAYAPPLDTRVWEPLPPADEIADRLGARRAGANGWRLPHLCEGKHPSAPIPPNSGFSLLRLPDGTARVTCFYGCPPDTAYAALRYALGIAGAPPDTAASAIRIASPRQQDDRPQVTAAEARRRNDAARNQPPGAIELIAGTGWPRLRQPQRTYSDLLDGIAAARWTAWTDYTLADGQPDTLFRRFPARAGAKSLWATKATDAAFRQHSGLHPAYWDNPAAGEDDPVVVVEGEKAAAALASAQPAGWRIASGGAESLLRSLALDTLLSAPRVLIWPDNDAPGIIAGAGLAQRMIDAGAAPQDTILIDAADVAAAARLHNPSVDTDGIDAADLPPELVTALIHAGAKRNGGIAGNDRVLRRPQRTRDEYCVSIRAMIECQDSTGAGAVIPILCRECDGCVAYLRRCDTARYAFGRESGPQSIIRYPYDTPAECRQVVRAIHGAVKRHNDTANRPSVQLRNGHSLVMAFAAPLPDDCASAIERLLERAGKGTLERRRELTPPQFHGLVPAARRQHTHLDGDNDGAALLSVVFSDEWPAFTAPARDYAYTDGAVLDLDTTAPPDTRDLHTPQTIARRKLGREWSAFANSTDWLATCHTDIPLELWRALETAAVATPAEKYGVATEIRAATGYAGPVALLVDALTGDRQCHRLVRQRVAGLPPELITPPKPQLRRRRRFAKR